MTLQTQLEVAAPPAPMTTAQLLDALREHFIKPHESRPGAVFLTEVTAPDRTHRADAIHVGLWASRGYTVDVCELKASRADFQRELDKPSKAEAWWAHSNTFTIVAPDITMAPPELLPPGWGLMVPNPRSRRFKVVVKPGHRDLQPTTALLAALLVSMETDRENALERQRHRLSDQYYQQMQEARRLAQSERDPGLDRRLAALAEFEKLVGFKLDGQHGYGDRLTPADMASVFREVVADRRAASGAERKLGVLESCAGQVLDAIALARKDLAAGGAPR